MKLKRKSVTQMSKIKRVTMKGYFLSLKKSSAKIAIFVFLLCSRETEVEIHTALAGDIR